METRQFVALLVRVFSVVLFIYAINNVVNTISFMIEPEFQSVTYYYLASSACIVLIAFVLWMFPLTIAKKILPLGNGEKSKIGSISYEDMRSICFSTLALFLLFNVVSDAVYWGSFLIFFEETRNNPIVISASQKASMIATVVELAIVLPLLFGRKGFAKMFYKLRYGA